MSATSCLYIGRVHHHRRSPRQHQFGFHTYMLLLDLSELPTVFAGRLLWSTGGPAFAQFRELDHLVNYPSKFSLREKVLSVVAEHGVTETIGPIRLLTQLRYLGFVMNPVNFYYCYDELDSSVVAIIAEVNNTPWGEQHLYVVRGNSTNRTIIANNVNKEFHVSPFMPLTMHYRMLFTQPSDKLNLTIENFSCNAGETDRPVFSASMALEKKPLTTWNLNLVLLRFPLISFQIFATIYWQAVRLYLKRLPIYKHQKQTAEPRAHAGSVTTSSTPPLTASKSKVMASQ